MSESNLRICPKCGKNIGQSYIRVEEDHILRTRKCKHCKEYSIKTVEVSLETYNTSVKKLNAIVEIMGVKKSES